MFTLWQAFILFGALQSLLLALAVSLRPESHRPTSVLLGLLLLVNAILLGEYVLIATGFYADLPHLLGFSIPLLFVIGPLYHGYVLSLLGERLSDRRPEHWLPAAVALLCLQSFYWQSATSKAQWMHAVLTQGFPQFPIGYILLLAAANCSLIVYFYRSYLVLEQAAERLGDEFSGSGVLTVQWLKRSAAVFSVTLVLFLLLWCDMLQRHPQFTVLPAVASLLTLLALGLGVLAYWQPELLTQATRLDLPVSPTEAAAPVKYEKTALPAEQRQQCLQRLQTHMTRQRPYLDCNLRLSVLADQLGLPAHQLSQVINQELQLNFFEFINGYRVEAAKTLLRATPASGSMLEIALQAGFNSKASFNRIFKQQTGLTPTGYAAAKP
ncbi:MAG TPA: helix-turn-helix domain-containing protein [Candidatus Acidoferrum sp.]|nr:helix-turn-helix domain-containing protein [Candidatus Acidoferrum sp.]